MAPHFMQPLFTVFPNLSSDWGRGHVEGRYTTGGEMAGNSVFGVVIFNAHSFSSFLWRTNEVSFPSVVSETLLISQKPKLFWHHLY